jgi:hypothetical protein
VSNKLCLSIRSSIDTSTSAHLLRWSLQADYISKLRGGVNEGEGHSRKLKAMIRHLMNLLVRITRSVTFSPTTRTSAPDVNRTSAALGSPNTLASQAGFTLPLRKKQPPKNTICATFFAKLGSSWIACKGTRFQRSASIFRFPTCFFVAGSQKTISGLLEPLALSAASRQPFSELSPIELRSHRPAC